MQCTLQELTDKFHRALDHDSNVVDMRTVLEVISLLEDFPVTKETLGQTRVGKWVNDMRRKTKDKDLSRRAKNLVRRWKQIVDAAEAVNGEGVAARPSGGQPQPIPPYLAKSLGSKPSSPISRPTTPSSGKSTQSPSLPSRSRPDTPSALSHPNTPSGQGHSPSLPLTRPGTPGSTELPLSPGPHDVTPTQANSRFNHQDPNRPHHGSEAMSTPTQSPPTEGTPSGTAESLSKTNATNKKRRRENDLTSLPNKKLNIGNDSAAWVDGKTTTKTPRNGIALSVHARAALQRPDSPLTTCDKVAVTPLSGVGASRLQRTSSQTSVPSPGGDRGVGDQVMPLVSPSRSICLAVKAEADRPRDRTPASSRKPKVKTTAELIQDMKAQGSLQLSSTEMSNRIARNQIEKEEDPINVSIVPAGARPRPRRKPGTVVPPSISEKTLSETKKEMMHKFLQNSCNPLAGDHYERTTPSPINLDPHSRTASPVFNDLANYGGDPIMMHNNGSANVSLESNEMHVDIMTPFFTDDHNMRHVGQMSVPVIGEDDDPWSTLPPLLPEVEIDWSEYVYEPPDLTVDSSHVDRLHTEQWSGVNGQYDQNNKWVDWTQMQSVPSYGGDLLPILPYIDMD